MRVFLDAVPLELDAFFLEAGAIILDFDTNQYKIRQNLLQIDTNSLKWIVFLVKT